MSDHNPARFHLWLETVLNFLYFIGASPFRYKYDVQRGKYTLISPLFTRVLSGGIHSLGVIVSLFGLYTYTISSPSLQNPRCIFHVVVSYSRFIIYYALLFTLWMRHVYFENFFTFSSVTFPATTSSAPEASTVSYNKKRKFVVVVLCFLMVSAAFILEILSSTGISGFYEYIVLTFSRQGGPHSLEKALGIQHHHHIQRNVQSQLAPNLSLHPDMPNVVPPPLPLPLISHLDYAFTLFFNVVVIYVRVCNNVAMLFCILAGMTFQQATNYFVNLVTTERDQDKAILKYLEFCKFVNCLNNLCGCIMLATVVCSPPFFLVYFIGTFVNFEHDGPRVIFYTVLYCCLYVIATEGSSKVSELKEWIIEHGESDNECQLFAIFVEISENPMGLRGMGCFTITHTFLSQMFATIVTFTIILMQFETTPSNAITNTPCT